MIVCCCIWSGSFISSVRWWSRRPMINIHSSEHWNPFWCQHWSWSISVLSSEPLIIGFYLSRVMTLLQRSILGLKTSKSRTTSSTALFDIHAILDQNTPRARMDLNLAYSIAKRPIGNKIYFKSITILLKGYNTDVRRQWWYRKGHIWSLWRGVLVDKVPDLLGSENDNQCSTYFN